MRDEEPAEAIIEMERAALDRSDKGDPSGFLDISADDITYVDPFLAKPIHGVEALREYCKNVEVSKGAGETFNVKTQVLEDVVVLTYNYVYRFADRNETHRWNSTEIYHRTPAGWRIVHTHWSWIKPELAKTS